MVEESSQQLGLFWKKWRRDEMVMVMVSNSGAFGYFRRDMVASW